MRRLRAALAVCALAAVPVALSAQQAQTQAPVTHPHYPVRPRPLPSGAYGHGNHGHSGNTYANGYPLLIDGSVVNRVLATPSPKPHHTPKPRPQFGEQTFETHSTTDNSR